MSIAAIISHFNDKINPIAVKEMRQAVKGRFISWVLILFLLSQLVILGAVLLLTENLGEDFNMGRNIFMALLAVLLSTCSLFIPALTALRLSSERSDTNIDLLFVTTLKPTQIIWGKLSAALVLTLLFFSASMPFLTLTFLLRGLDLPSIFILLAFDFVIVAGCIQFGILLASMPGKIVARGIRFLAGLFSLFFVLGMTMTFSGGMLFEGIGSTVNSWDFWGPALTVAVLMLLGIGLMFVISVSIITPSSANKAFAVRLYLILIWIVTGITAGIWTYTSSDTEIFLFWTVHMTFLFCAMLFVSICERQQLGLRIRRTIPKNRLLRFFAFLFYSGASGGMTLSVIMIMATFLITGAINSIAMIMGHSSFYELFYSDTLEHLFLKTIIFSLYALAYALTALMIRRGSFAKSTNPNTTAIIAFFLVIVGSIVPMVIGFMLHSGRWYTIAPQWYIGNPFVVFWENKILPQCLSFSAIWALGAVVITLPWYYRQVKNFKPLTPDLPQTVEAQDE